MKVLKLRQHEPDRTSASFKDHAQALLYMVYSNEYKAKTWTPDESSFG